MQLHPGQPNQPLLDPDVPPFNFDTIYGLTYQIDPTRPLGNRIKSLCFEGEPLSSNAEFALVTNQFRAAGGGGFQSADETGLILKTNIRTEDAIRRFLGTGTRPLWDHTQSWRFGCHKPVRAVLETSPKAIRCLGEIAHLQPQSLGMADNGFAQVRLTL
jgi:2',3'-cyclic-nucleotide 2'-phosphodiesterase/3'-nucleotidase